MPHGAPLWPNYGDFQSAPINGHSQRPSACIKGAKPRHHRGMLLWRAIPTARLQRRPLKLTWAATRSFAAAAQELRERLCALNGWRRAHSNANCDRFSRVRQMVGRGPQELRG